MSNPREIFRIGSREGRRVSLLSPGAAENPFSTRYVGPDAVPFLFPTGLTAEALFEQFLSVGGWGEVLGPHGSGKTTLLEALRRVAEARGHAVNSLRLNRSNPRLPGRWWRFDAGEGLRKFVFLDGAELLPRLTFWLIQKYCLWSRTGLLVTTHWPLGLPRLYETRVDADLAVRVARHILEQSTGVPRRVAPEEAAAALRAHQGNLREALFELYHCYEERSTPGARRGD